MKGYDIMKNENREYCKRIAEEIDEIVYGHVLKCPECGEIINEGDLHAVNGYGDAICPHCGAEHGPDEWNVTVWEYLSDAFDVEYRVSGDSTYRSARFMIACGGPNVYVDTATRSVELYWWAERASYLLSDEAVAEIDAYAEEMWECGRGCF